MPRRPVSCHCSVTCPPVPLKLAAAAIFPLVTELVLLRRPGGAGRQRASDQPQPAARLRQPQRGGAAVVGRGDGPRGGRASSGEPPARHLPGPRVRRPGQQVRPQSQVRPRCTPRDVSGATSSSSSRVGGCCDAALGSAPQKMLRRSGVPAVQSWIVNISNGVCMTPVSSG